MALSRRAFLAASATGAALIAACHGVRTRVQTTPYRVLARTVAEPDGERVVVFMPDTQQTREVWTGLSDELGDALGLVAIELNRADDVAIIARAIREHRPRAVVLMNNPTLAAYRAYRRTAGAAKLPAVVLMVSLLDRAALGLENASAVRYEVPLVTAVTQLRRLIATPIRRVGVVLRAPFSPLIHFEAELSRREHIELVEARVSHAPNESEVKRALRRVKRDADALWIMNDDRLLTPRLIAEGWIAELSERPLLPTIVGVQSLVGSAGAFGTFAVLPDHRSFGAQAAEMLFDARDENWTLAEGRIELPMSTTTILDLEQARTRGTLRKDAEAQVDVVLTAARGRPAD